MKISLFTTIASTLFCNIWAGGAENTTSPQQQACAKPMEGWVFDLGGQYTWMSFTSPPTYKGSTGGAVAKATYQKRSQFYGQVRSVYNAGKLRSSNNHARERESYTEMVGGYCIDAAGYWSVTPYVGLGMDYIWENRDAFSTFDDIKLRYHTYYAIGGFEAKYLRNSYYLGLQMECLPVFDQTLRIKGQTGAAWTLNSRVGADVKIPIGVKLTKSYWFELVPYYRFFPVGSSAVLSLPHRNLNQWGAFVSFRFFI